MNEDWLRRCESLAMGQVVTQQIIANPLWLTSTWHDGISILRNKRLHDSEQLNLVY